MLIGSVPLQINKWKRVLRIKNLPEYCQTSFYTFNIFSILFDWDCGASTTTSEAESERLIRLKINDMTKVDSINHGAHYQIILWWGFQNYRSKIARSKGMYVWSIWYLRIKLVVVLKGQCFLWVGFGSLLTVMALKVTQKQLRYLLTYILYVVSFLNFIAFDKHSEATQSFVDVTYRPPTIYYMNVPKGFLLQSLINY